MGDQEIAPWLASVGCRMVRGIGAPSHGDFFFGKYNLVVHLIGGLGFQHIDRV